MIIFLGIIKIALFLTLMLISFNRLITFFRLRFDWKAATSMAVASPVAYLFAICTVESTGYLPRVGPAFRQVPGVMILGRIDLAQPWESLAGFIVVDAIPIVLAMGVFVSIAARVRPARNWSFVLVWSWMIVSFGYAWLLQKAGLPDPSKSRYAKLYGATIQLLQQVPTTPLGQGLGIVVGALIFMVAIVALCSQIRSVIRYANEKRYWPDRFKGSGSGRTMTLLVGCYLTFIATQGVWQKTLPASWIPSLAAGAIVPDAASIGFLTAYVLVVAGLTAVVARMSGKRMAGVGWNGRRPSEIVCGLLFAGVAASGWVVISNALGRPVLSSWPALPSAQVFPYIAVILAAAIVRVLVLQGVLLQALASYYSFTAAAALSSAGSIMIFGLQARTTWLTLVFAVAMCMFECFLFRAVGSLWCLAALDFGWTFLIGAVFQLPTAGLQGMGQIPSFTRPADWLTGGRTGPESGVASLLVICMGFTICSFVENSHKGLAVDGRLRTY